MICKIKKLNMITPSFEKMLSYEFCYLNLKKKNII